MSPNISSDADFARPGDPGFTNFPKTLLEDCVSYDVYVIGADKITPAKARFRLTQFHKAASDLVRTLLKDYIWQREEFSLSLVQHDQRSTNRFTGGWHLHGKTEFGDSIADEWVVVYLLRKLSEKFHDVWVQVVDGDGQFLLAEAANAIPKWLNPDVADNRVWIHRGTLKIIPQGIPASETPSAPPKRSSRGAMPPALNVALEYLSSDPGDLIEGSEVQKEAFYRLRNFPDQISQSMHLANVTIPRKLAQILHRTPKSISSAVEAFYLRDPISLKSLHSTDPNDSIFAPDSKHLVTTSVRFTRVGYAQLKSQEFRPPNIWASHLQASPSPEDQSRMEMGMKVSCGFEMLIRDPQNQDKKSVREIKLLLDDIDCGEEALPSDEEIKARKRQEDDESWLDVNFEDFEKELSGKSKDKSNGEKYPPGSFGDRAAQENLRRIVERFQDFLNDDSAGMDGAEFGDELSDDDSHSAQSGSTNDDDLDEDRLNGLMKEVMNFRSDDLGNDRIQELDQQDRVMGVEGSNGSEGSEDDIEAFSKAMEVELNKSGALNLEPPGLDAQLVGMQGHVKYGNPPADADPRHILAKNFLQSLRGQAGTPGPAHALMSAMGLSMPRDEDDGDE